MDVDGYCLLPLFICLLAFTNLCLLIKLVFEKKGGSTEGGSNPNSQSYNKLFKSAMNITVYLKALLQHHQRTSVYGNILVCCQFVLGASYCWRTYQMPMFGMKESIKTNCLTVCFQAFFVTTAEGPSKAKRSPLENSIASVNNCPKKWSNLPAALAIHLPVQKDAGQTSRSGTK